MTCMKPVGRSLNIPNEKKQWKDPVHCWIGDMYSKTQKEMIKGSGGKQRAAVEMVTIFNK